jgi:serine/threonine-protein kinase RsbW
MGMPLALMKHPDDSRTSPKAIELAQCAWEHVSADPATAARVRVELGTWLRARSVNDDRVDDILLAVYEAFANAAEYAYREQAAPGTVDVEARLDDDADTLVVTVIDQGHWHKRRPMSADPAHDLRGRGIPLMKALTSDASIRNTSDGTRVELTWRGLSQVNS